MNSQAFSFLATPDYAVPRAKARCLFLYNGRRAFPSDGAGAKDFVAISSEKVRSHCKPRPWPSKQGKATSSPEKCPRNAIEALHSGFIACTGSIRKSPAGRGGLLAICGRKSSSYAKPGESELAAQSLARPDDCDCSSKQPLGKPDLQRANHQKTEIGKPQRLWRNSDFSRMSERAFETRPLAVQAGRKRLQALESALESEITGLIAALR